MSDAIDRHTSDRATRPASLFARRPLPQDRRMPLGPKSKTIGGLLPRITSKAFEKYGFHSAEILTSWPTIAGSELAGVTIPERIKWPRHKSSDTETASRVTDRATANPTERRRGGRGNDALGATLILRAEPSAALEVSYRAREIADRVNRFFGYGAIAQVKVVQGPIPEPKAAAQPPRLATTPAVREASPGNTTVSDALAALARNIENAARRR